MTTHRVEFTDQARQAMDSYADHIEGESGSFEIARRWLQRVYESIETLRYMPKRYELAEDGIDCDYEVRRLLIGNYLALYYVDDNEHIVHILNFRHGARLPRPGDLPDDPAG